jgi:hypothetical protein
MRRTTLIAAAALAASLPVGAGAATIERASPTAPKSGAGYSGKTEEGQRVTLRISGRSIEIAAWRFRCGDEVLGITSLEAILLRHSENGYRFKLTTNGIVSYSDEAPDENARIAFRGQFTRSARGVSGLFRVKTRRCGDTGYVEWRAKRRSNS